MEHLRSIGIFVRAVELQSFAAAAGALALTPSAVSKAVAGLEASLGVRLLTRAARGVTLTDEGARFYARCRTIVSELEAAEREASGSRGAARGRLRVALHTGLAQVTNWISAMRRATRFFSIGSPMNTPTSIPSASRLREPGASRTSS